MKSTTMEAAAMEAAEASARRRHRWRQHAKCCNREQPYNCLPEHIFPPTTNRSAPTNISWRRKFRACSQSLRELIHMNSHSWVTAVNVTAQLLKIRLDPSCDCFECIVCG
jgi:hypothetical protein